MLAVKHQGPPKLLAVQCNDCKGWADDIGVIDPMTAFRLAIARRFFVRASVGTDYCEPCGKRRGLTGT